MSDWIEELKAAEVQDGWHFPLHIVRQELIDSRGWTPDLIDSFLSPDLIEPNPHNLSQRMRLYLKETVFQVEHSPAFLEAYLEVHRDKLTPVQRMKAGRKVRQKKNQFRNSALMNRRNISRALTSPTRYNEEMSLQALGLMP